MLIVAVVGLALGAAGAWWWTRARDAGAPAGAAPVAATDVPLAAADPARTLPPLDQMDTFLRALLGALSTSPELARWLATDDLIRQMANAIDRVSRGESPARDLAVVRPSGFFEASGPRSRPTIDPSSYRRYDALATLVWSLDARAVADAYRTVRPRLDEAYRGLGRTEGSVDDAVALALDLMLDTPVVEDPVRLAPGPGATYVFADPQVEALAPAQKQLIRMGPRNLTRVKTRLGEIRDALQRAR
jgi:hypothetical protein